LAQEAVITVQGYSQFSDISATSDGQTTRIEGRLEDDLGQGVTGQDVLITGTDAFLKVRTQNGGRFEGELSEGAPQVRLEYPGVASLIGTHLDRIKVERLAPEVTVQGPETVGVGEDFQVTALLKRGERPLARRLLTLTTQATETPCTTDRHGHCQWTLSAPTAGIETYRIIWRHGTESMTSNHTVEVQRPMNAALTIHGVMAGRDGPYLLTELNLLAPRPSKAIGSIQIGGKTLESRGLSSSTQFRIPWSELSEGNNVISAQVRSEVVGWAPVILAEQNYLRPSQWVASNWPMGLIAAILVGCVVYLTIRIVRTRQHMSRTPSPAPLIKPSIVFHDAKDVPKSHGLNVYVVAGETNTVLESQVTPCRELSRAESGRHHDNAGLDAAHTNAQGHVSFSKAPPALLVQAPGRVGVACQIPHQTHSVTVELWKPRGYAQRTFMNFLVHAGFPRLQFGRDTPREAGEILKSRGYASDAIDDAVSRIEHICFGQSSASVRTVLEFEARLDCISPPRAVQ